MKKKIYLKRRRDKEISLTIDPIKMVSILGSVKGLMFSRRNNASALLFEFSKPSMYAIHSLFVFFPFIAIWIDKNDRVLEWKLVRPWTFNVKCNYKFSRLIEIPINNKYKNVVGKLLRERFI
jgi:uncharacterized membrane protein (UPF0127 family)